MACIYSCMNGMNDKMYMRMHLVEGYADHAAHNATSILL